MQANIILAGVGGQGILTNAKALCIAALKLGLNIKQAEVHGMSQRGGAVQSHLRIADGPIASDLIPHGQADLILSVEPMEALRYVDYLREGGAIVASINAYVNIDNYPSLDEVLAQIANHPRHTLLNAERISKLAGSGRSANVVLLGAASLLLEIDPDELEAAVATMFAPKGEKVVEMNRKAFRAGRNAGRAYLDGLDQGVPFRTVLEWLDSLDLEQMLAPDGLDCEALKKKI